MLEPQDRRSALTRIAAAAATAAAAAVPGIAAADAAESAAPDDGADAEKKGHGGRHRPILFFKGRLSDIVYTPVGSGNTPNYLITATGGGGEMDDKRKHRRRSMTDAHLAAYIERRTNGAMNGFQCLFIEDMAWRVQTVSYDAATNQWTMMARVCDSNPNARPSVSGAAAEAYSEATGCSCDCGSSCYRCKDGKYHCGYDEGGACGENAFGG